jgi:hypothetical protein
VQRKLARCFLQRARCALQKPRERQPANGAKHCLAAVFCALAVDSVIPLPQLFG